MYTCQIFGDLYRKLKFTPKEGILEGSFPGDFSRRFQDLVNEKGYEEYKRQIRREQKRDPVLDGIVLIRSKISPLHNPNSGIVLLKLGENNYIVPFSKNPIFPECGGIDSSWGYKTEISHLTKLSVNPELLNVMRENEKSDISKIFTYMRGRKTALDQYLRAISET